MAVTLKMVELVRHVHSLATATERGTEMAMIAATEMAYKDAVLAAKKNFNNTPGRTRSGFLTNSLYRGYNKKEKQGYVGNKAPYGAIQEFGGPIKPVTAKHLWIKNYDVDAKFKRWSPRDFMDAMMKSEDYEIFTNPHTGALVAAYTKDSKTGPAQVMALFTLVKGVKIPARPYIRPAVEHAFAELVKLEKIYIEQEASK